MPLTAIIIKKLTQTSHVFFSQNTFLCGPLETSNDRVLDFVQVLDSLSDIDNYIWTGSVWTEAPNLTGFSNILKNFKINISLRI